MLDVIIRYSLKYRTPVLVISLILLVCGSYFTTTLPIDVFPDLDRPRVVLLTECPGLATEEVESLVTHPIELSLLSGNGVQAVRSQSTAGLSVIYIEFDWSTKIQTARQNVQERINSIARELPEGIAPQMTPQSSIMGQIVIAGLYRRPGPDGGMISQISNTDLVAEWNQENDQIKVWQPESRRATSTWKPVESATVVTTVHGTVADQPVLTATLKIDGHQHSVTFEDPNRLHRELGTIGQWVVRPRLLKVKGISEVFLQGGDRKQYQVLVNPNALTEYDVTLQDVESAIQSSNLNTSGGFAITGETERPIRIMGRVGPQSDFVINDLLQVPVKTNEKRTILLREVAEVAEGAQLLRGDAAVDGQPAAVLSIVKQPHVDTRDLTDRIVRALEEIESTLPIDVAINPELFQLRKFIDRGVFNVAEALVIGSILVIIVLFLFLLNFRTTFITLTAIPLSLVLTTIAFRLISYLTDTELTINVMTLGGIAVAIGELVDDAIVDVENIFRRLKENNLAAEKKSALRVVYEASLEVRSAIVFGTAVVVLAFLPLLGMTGLSGRLFAPLAFAYMIAIMSSLLVSVTVTPVLSYFMLPGAPASLRQRESLLVRFIKSITSVFIRTGMKIPGTLLLLTWLAVAGSVVMFMNLGGGFLPDFDEGSVQINASLPPGSSLYASGAVASMIDNKLKELQKNPNNPDGDILHFVRRTGRAEMDEHAIPVNISEYVVSMNPDSKLGREEMVAKLLAELKQEVPGVYIEVEQPLAHLISHMVSGVYAQIAIKIFGDDLDELQQLAKQSKQIIQQVDGITDPIIEPIQQTEELHIQLRAADLAFFGITRSYVAEILETALQGRVVSQVLDGQRRFDLLVRFDEEYRNNYIDLPYLRIDLPDDRGQIQLREVADVEVGYGPNALNRDNARRRMVIRCNTAGRDLTGAAQEIEQRLSEQLELPEGYFVEYGGQFESQKNATRTIALLALFAVAGIFITLLILFPSIRIVLQILNALPTAFIGGVLALYLTGQDLNIAALVGFISLGGIAVRNGILLVTHYIHLMRVENEGFTKEMILRGSLERLTPVLMTALTAGIALIPLVIGGNEPGREILYPVATVILGGLFTSTFCEFLIHPGIFWKFSGKDAVKIAHPESGENEF